MNCIPANIPDEISEKLFISDAYELMTNIIDLEKEGLPDSILMNLIKQEGKNDIRCWALLKIKYITNIDDAKFIVSKLLEDDSRIRELSSEIIYNHFNLYGKECYELFNNEDFYNTFIETLTDINPRVTRNITYCYDYLNNKEFLIDLLLDAIESKEGQFVRHWALEGIGKIINLVDKNKLNQLSDKFARTFDDIIYLNDQLLNEKVAFILVHLAEIIDYRKYPKLKKKVLKLKNTNHFFIKQVAANILINEE